LSFFIHWLSYTAEKGNYLKILFEEKFDFYFFKIKGLKAFTGAAFHSILSAFFLV